MTKKIQERKSISKTGKKKFLAKKPVDKGGRPRKTRVGDILTDKQGVELLTLAMQKAREGDVVLIKSLIEQKYGRPISTVEASVKANVSIELINYGDDTLQLRP